MAAAVAPADQARPPLGGAPPRSAAASPGAGASSDGDAAAAGVDAASREDVAGADAASLQDSVGGAGADASSDGVARYEDTREGAAALLPASAFSASSPPRRPAAQFVDMNMGRPCSEGSERESVDVNVGRPRPDVGEREALLHAARLVTREAKLQASKFNSSRSDCSMGDVDEQRPHLPPQFATHALFPRSRHMALRQQRPSFSDLQEMGIPESAGHDAVAASGSGRPRAPMFVNHSSSAESVSEDQPAAEAVAAVPPVLVPKSANAQRTTSDDIPDGAGPLDFPELGRQWGPGAGTEFGALAAEGAGPDRALSTTPTRRRGSSGTPVSRAFSADDRSEAESIPGEEGIAPPNSSPTSMAPRMPSSPGADLSGVARAEGLLPDPLPEEEESHDGAIVEAAVGTVATAVAGAVAVAVTGAVGGVVHHLREETRRYWDGLGSSIAALWAVADETAIWAEQRLEQECHRALQSACLSREIAKARILDFSAPLRSTVIGSFKEMIKGACLSDPDMWPGVKKCYADALDRVLDDIEHEIEVTLEAALLKQHSLGEAAGPSGGILLACYCRVRTFVLYHYLPHDLTIFGKIKDPVYIVITVLTLLPVHLLRLAFFCLVLVFLLFPGPPDEFQMINFILMLKGSQFISSGLFMMARGSMSYFGCFACCKANMGECISENGPGASDSLSLGVIDYLGSIVLPWVAFHWLPRSQKHVMRAYVGRRNSLDEVAEEDEEAAETGGSSIAAAMAAVPSFRNSGPSAGSPFAFTSTNGSPTSVASTQQGGSLIALLWYDVKSFLFSLAVLMVLAVYTWRADDNRDSFATKWDWLLHSPQFHEDLFWVKVLYGLLTLPFLPFMVPLFLKVLTHCEWTGFNEHGACIEYALPAESRTSWKRRHPRPNLFSQVRRGISGVLVRLRQFASGCVGRHGHAQ